MSPQPRLLQILNILSVILLAAAAIMVFTYAPIEKVMGAVQKVFYFHVATAWVGMIGFIAAAVVAIIYLVTKDLKWDAINLAAIEISLVFFFIAIFLGSIWARTFSDSRCVLDTCLISHRGRTRGADSEAIRCW